MATRLKGRLRVLRTRLGRQDTLLQAVRESNASTDPKDVAEWLVRQANSWIAAPCWVVVARDNSDRLTPMADSGLTPALGPSLWSATEWVMAHGRELLVADMAKEGRAGSRGAGTVVAFPLICRNQTIGALVGIDPQASSSTPVLGAALLLSLRGLLEPPAIALENALALQKEKQLSVTDDLTLLSNSRHLNAVLRQETKRAMRSQSSLSFLFLDLDGFKQVNDNHGHLMGSKALVEAGRVVKACARETDVVARFGGDEFSLVLPDTDPEGAMAVAKRIQEKFRANIFLTSEGLAVRLTVSIGVATLPGAAKSADELLKAADTAMYQVKALGKDGIHVA